MPPGGGRSSRYETNGGGNGHGAIATSARPDELTTHELGAEGERIAMRLLESFGYDIVAHGWTCPAGEVDVIALDGETHVLVEVKTRLCRDKPAPVSAEQAVDARKRARYRAIARWYLGAVGSEVPLRFDVIAISVAADGICSCRHLRDAFGGDR